jgi:hypothetical protein
MLFFFNGKIHAGFLAKNALGNILGDFFTNLSGRPVIGPEVIKA